MKTIRISCIGSGDALPGSPQYELALEAGRLLAEAGWTVVCGGLRGVMEAVCKGAKKAGGSTVGILPTSDPADANDWVDTPVATGLGPMRNYLVILNGDAVLAFEGGAGTRSELALSQKTGKEVVALARFSGFDELIYAHSPAEAVMELTKIVGAR
ncbi:TIGR00725 family protein [Oceanidesulfovibrio marinus]|uniref:TIGR00725 family protein n=1 Tax=Oceanidesulfovibrio marinus TaxID=370038 RepID=A0ABX6NEU0_9BACT|nr:TIGR00725 family protein [Oceanidesulfovibrio marinus]QJT08110.1 TIGR00725 family protein [Oceanidesulfovibrio marinus]